MMNTVEDANAPAPTIKAAGLPDAVQIHPDEKLAQCAKSAGISLLAPPALGIQAAPILPPLRYGERSGVIHGVRLWGRRKLSGFWLEA
jgi:hypothetical protein